MQTLVRTLLKTLFVRNAKLVVPLLASIPGAGIMYIELADYLDNDPATAFEPAVFGMAAVSTVMYFGKKAVEKYLNGDSN